MSTQEDHSHLVCVCKTCAESKHFLASNNEPEVNTDEMPVVVFFLSKPGEKAGDYNGKYGAHITTMVSALCSL